ncbi:hypothetical protein QYE76_067609 [Lolium multiflorum]|uniref:Uncharacterized protein n=1 Tax=Lolium multiflorum TaxID=4521 RepID=A0AAD8WD53_LOLMU|nr:hypothetical protein QYE76_067609 [Lolium multiflorum]
MQLSKQYMRYRIIRGQELKQGTMKDKVLRRRRRRKSQGVFGVSNLAITLTTVLLLSVIYVSLYTMLPMLVTFIKLLSLQQFSMHGYANEALMFFELACGAFKAKVENPRLAKVTIDGDVMTIPELIDQLKKIVASEKFIWEVFHFKDNVYTVKLPKTKNRRADSQEQQLLLASVRVLPADGKRAGEPVVATCERAVHTAAKEGSAMAADASLDGDGWGILAQRIRLQELAASGMSPLSTTVTETADTSPTSNVDPNNVPLASLVAQEENVDVNFIKNNNFNNNAYRNNSGNNYRPYPSANGNGYGNSYGNSYNNNRSVPSGLEAMLKEFISTQTAFNKSVEEKLDKIDTIASRVDRLASDVNLLKLKVMPNNDIDNKITTTANAIQVRINENIRLMAELRARWDREENEKLAKENNVAKVWTITTTSNANSSHVAAPPTINGNIIGVGNVSTPSAKRTKLPEIAKTAETACDKTAEIFSNLGNNDPIDVAHNDLDFDDCHISEVIKFLQKLAKSPNASAINLAFTKHITNALIKAREEKLKLETSIPRKLEDGWEPIIKMKFNEFECNALCDLGASISVMPKKIYDMLDLPPLKNCYLDVNLADNVKKKPLGRIDNVHYG